MPVSLSLPPPATPNHPPDHRRRRSRSRRIPRRYCWGRGVGEHCRETVSISHRPPLKLCNSKISRNFRTHVHDRYLCNRTYHRTARKEKPPVCNILAGKTLTKKEINKIILHGTHLDGQGVRDYHNDHRYVEGDQRTEDEKSSIVDHAHPWIRHNVLGVVQTCNLYKRTVCEIRVEKRSGRIANDASASGNIDVVL